MDMVACMELSREPCEMNDRDYSCGNCLEGFQGAAAPSNDTCEPLNSTDCTVSDWTEWSSCSQSCGNGLSERTRFIVNEPVYGGEPCPPFRNRRPCFIQDCPLVLPSCALTRQNITAEVDVGQSPRRLQAAVRRLEDDGGNGKCEASPSAPSPPSPAGTSA